MADTLVTLLSRERATNRLGFFGDDGEQDACRAVRTAAPLLPCMDRGDIEPKTLSEGTLGKTQHLPQSRDIDTIRHGHGVFGQLEIAARVGKRLMEPLDYAAAQRAMTPFRARP
jgi:hypothetical protein